MIDLGFTKSSHWFVSSEGYFVWFIRVSLVWIQCELAGKFFKNMMLLDGVLLKIHNRFLADFLKSFRPDGCELSKFLRNDFLKKLLRFFGRESLDDAQ